MLTLGVKLILNCILPSLNLEKIRNRHRSHRQRTKYLLLQRQVRLLWPGHTDRGLPNSLSPTELTKSQQSSSTVSGLFCRDTPVIRQHSSGGWAEREKKKWKQEPEHSALGTWSSVIIGYLRSALDSSLIKQAFWELRCSPQFLAHNEPSMKSSFHYQEY